MISAGKGNDEVSYQRNYHAYLKLCKRTADRFYGLACNNGSDIHVSWVEGESTEAPTSIVNKQGVELPATGGIGTTIFYAIGTILVLGAGILLVTRRRMEAR